LCISIHSTQRVTMKALFHLSMTAALALQTFTAHAATDDKEVNMTCAAYYYTLSFHFPGMVRDLTRDQAVKASFAFRKQP
jgi:hypothetical protein